MMMGIGTDIVQIPRIEKLLGSTKGKAFVLRILNTKEQALAEKHKKNKKQYAAHIARRFAAKEAVAKALGTGIGAAVGFHDITITNLPSGAPKAELSAKAKRLLKGTKTSIHLSLSDDYPAALAFAVISA